MYLFEKFLEMAKHWRKRRANVGNVKPDQPDECAAEAWHMRLWRKVQTIEVAWCMGLLIACVVYRMAIYWCTTDLLPNYVVKLKEFRMMSDLGLFKLYAISDDRIEFIYKTATTDCLADENVKCRTTDKFDSTRRESVWNYNYTHVHVSIPIHGGIFSDVERLKVFCSFSLPCVDDMEQFGFDIPMYLIRAEYKRITFAVLTYILYAAVLVLSIHTLRNSRALLLLLVLVFFAYLLYTPLHVTLYHQHQFGNITDPARMV